MKICIERPMKYFQCYRNLFSRLWFVEADANVPSWKVNDYLLIGNKV